MSAAVSVHCHHDGTSAVASVCCQHELVSTAVIDERTQQVSCAASMGLRILQPLWAVSKAWLTQQAAITVCHMLQLCRAASIIGKV